jgi:hypothetical protein
MENIVILLNLAKAKSIKYALSRIKLESEVLKETFYLQFSFEILFLEMYIV